LNDDTIAGIELIGKPVFSVQYHPEASAGPHDSRYLFDQFVDNMKQNKKMSHIAKVIGRQILDSRGNPTIEVDVYTIKWLCWPSSCSIRSFHRYS
jgi:hypothetical protein